jgi:hypothetical protein
VRKSSLLRGGEVGLGVLELGLHRDVVRPAAAPDRGRPDREEPEQQDRDPAAATGGLDELDLGIGDISGGVRRGKSGASIWISNKVRFSNTMIYLMRPEEIYLL